SARASRQEPHEDHLARAGGPVMAAKIKKGDRVVVLAGKDKGRQGAVLRVVVEGLNMVQRHTRPSQSDPQGGIKHKEAPLHVSNVALVDPKSGGPTKV